MVSQVVDEDCNYNVIPWVASGQESCDFANEHHTPSYQRGGPLRIATGTVCTSAFVAVALLAVATVRADAQELADQRMRVDTLEGGRIVVSNPDSPQAGPEGVPTLVEVLRIGSLDDTCDAFGRIMSLAVDGDGRIYVADSQASDIRLFSPEGECVRTFGRSGEGPGEFRLLAGIAWQPPGFLWTIDSVAERFTVFDSLGTVLATHPLRLGPAASHPWRMWVDGVGSLHFWLPGFDRTVKCGTGPGLDSLESVPEPESIPTREAYTEQAAVGGGRISVQRGIPPGAALFADVEAPHERREAFVPGTGLRVQESIGVDERLPGVADLQAAVEHLDHRAGA